MENTKDLKIVALMTYGNAQVYKFTTYSEVTEELIFAFLRKQLNTNQEFFENLNWAWNIYDPKIGVDLPIFAGQFDVPEIHLEGVYKRLFDSRNELNNPMVSMMDDFQKIIEYLKSQGYSFQRIDPLDWEPHKDQYNNEKPVYAELDIMNPTEEGTSNYSLSLTIYNKEEVNKANLYEPYLTIANDDGDYVSIDLWNPQNAFESKDIILGKIEAAVEHFIKIHYRADF